MALRRILALGAAIVAVGAVGSVAAHPVGGGAAGTTGCPGWDSGMMGGAGYGMGPGMMGGAGYGMGQGMTGGPGYGMMGAPATGAGGPWAGRPAGKLNLTVKDVSDFLSTRLASGGGRRLKVGDVTQKGDTITADVITAAHGDLVQRWAFDRNTGRMSPAG